MDIFFIQYKLFAVIKDILEFAHKGKLTEKALSLSKCHKDAYILLSEEMIIYHSCPYIRDEPVYWSSKFHS